MNNFSCKKQEAILMECGLAIVELREKHLHWHYRSLSDDFH